MTHKFYEPKTLEWIGQHYIVTPALHLDGTFTKAPNGRYHLTTCIPSRDRYEGGRPRWVGNLPLLSCTPTTLLRGIVSSRRITVEGCRSNVGTIKPIW
mmetsp:Transcript_14162/g.25588  ORF Transcript_14162/g.25588 Transcript_14162/m.25588 type:complete len:98 (+) Transcript_14162:2029-2322(+)